MLTPGCDRCGQCGCSCGTLPYTLTVTLSGLKNRTHSEHCRLKFSSSFGCGAEGVALDPGGCLDEEPECGDSNVGPLTKVLLTEPGHGYARVGYKQPVISISGGSGTGATFTPTLEAVDGTLASQCRTYKIKSVDVDDGSEYVDNETLTVTVDGNVVTKAVVVVRTGTTREEPTLTADVADVAGESLAVTLASNGDDPETWGIASVAISAAGAGWNSSEWTLPVTFATTGVAVSAASGIATKEVISPGAEYTFTSGGGTGFSAAVTLTEQTCDDGYPCWTPTSISIASGGTGYAVDDVIEFLAIDRDIANGIEGVANYTVLSVGGSGNVLSVSSPDVPEPFRKFTGGIGAVIMGSPGAYYALQDGGTPTSVDVVEPGEYFTIDPTAKHCTAKVDVTVSCPGGYLEPTESATITPTIEADPASANYGQITGLNISDGGDGYLVWHWLCTNQEPMNDVPFVLTAQNPKRLVNLSVNSCFGTDACVRIMPVGDDITCDEEPLTRAAAYSGQPSPINKIELVSGGYGYAKLGRKVPAWTVSQSGWTFTPTFTAQQTNWCGLPYWAVSSFSISGSGTPVESGTPLAISVSGNDKVDEHATATIVASGGTPQSVTVTRGGQYYREDATLPALVANVSVDQLPPSAGAGAAVSLTVNKTPGDPQFGKIISAQIDKKGGGYTLLGSPLDCVYASDPCPSSYAPRLEVVLRGAGKAPDVVLTDNRVIYETGGGNTTVLRAGDVIGDCSSFPSSASLLYGAQDKVSATISSGGTVTTSCTPPAWCLPCVCPADLINAEDCVSITSTLPCDDGTASYNGPWSDATLNCTYTYTAIDPITGVEATTEYENDVTFDAECCDFQCPDDGTCIKQVRVVASGSFFNAETNLPESLGDSFGDCVELSVDVENNVVTGSASVPIGPYSATVTFGCE